MAASVAGRRLLSTVSKAVRYNAHGAPQSVLKIESEEVSSTLGANDVLVKMNAFPITSGDFRQIEGYGGSRSEGVAGTEGVGTVMKVGSGVTHVRAKDLVVPTLPSFGTWRQMAIVNGDHVHSIPNTLRPQQAAFLGPTTCTALRMVSDFASLSAGDWIIQNGASGMVGQAVIQIAKAKGLKTINIVRGVNPGNMALENLQDIGADFVFPESYLMSADYKRLVADLPKPKLGINCIGGKSAADMARALGDGAHLVTYGGISRNGVTVPTSSLVSKNLVLSGFSYGKWAEGKSVAERDAMIQELVALTLDGKLSLSEAEEHNFADFDKALEKALAAHYSDHISEYFEQKVLVTL